MSINLDLKNFNPRPGNCFQSLVNADFADFTLVCEDSRQIKAHKVILSLGSAFFKQILRSNPHPHPLIYLKNFKFSELEFALTFMYFGQVEVGKNRINDFLKIAEDLKIKGLSENRVEDHERENEENLACDENYAVNINQQVSSMHEENTKDKKIWKRLLTGVLRSIIPY